jgi:hypothetical protein
MNFGQLIEFLDDKTDFPLLDGTPDETLAKARDGSHQDALAGELIAAMADGCDITGAETTLTRAETVNSLGPFRLKYMKDDAPVEGFRMVERIIQEIDAAFNEEGWQERQKES